MLLLGCSTTDVASAFNFEHYLILIVVMIGLNSEANISFQSHYFSIQVTFHLLNFIYIISQNLSASIADHSVTMVEEGRFTERQERLHFRPYREPFNQMRNFLLGQQYNDK
ncbi:unnamed protein product [Citrullus colocynthis]|uniref:Uncharacterized protein n=1 Tax=Citrullus colocynthis TaxID=252529 RepID=A0ABP0Y6M3_9ROSI